MAGHEHKQKRREEKKRKEKKRKEKKRKEKKRKEKKRRKKEKEEKTMSFGGNLMRSQVLYRAAQSTSTTHVQVTAKPSSSTSRS